MSQTFRQDIEGLRAIAVVPILLFHLKASLCPGGFAGVDIFFVISGYLITRMLLADIAAGDGVRPFSFKTFYVRRFFRLFPALLATLLGTLIAGWWVLGPSEYVSLARSALPSLLGVSNFYFLTAIDYFNAGVFGHSLLHTWSLGVEEQFYLVWPALLVMLTTWRRGIALLWPVLALGFVSLLAVQVLQPNWPDAAFYLMPFRMFEFAAGASILAIERRWNTLPAAAGTMPGAVGVALLAFTFWHYDGQTAWPGVSALVPVAATTLLLLSGARGVWASVLGLWPLRFLGRISYSLYLVHWPVITLYRAFAVTEPLGLELAGLAFASIALAVALYSYVEVPFRQTPFRQTTRKTGSSSADVIPAGWALSHRLKVQRLMLAAALFAGLFGAITFTSGFPSRLDRAKVQFLDKGLTFAGDLCSPSRAQCAFGDKAASRTVYVIGDSHALNLVHGLDRLFSEMGIKGVALYDHGCLYAYGTNTFVKGVADRNCRRNVTEAFEYLSSRREPVIIAGNFAGYRGVSAPEGATAPMQIAEAAYYAWLAERFEAGLEKLGAGHRPIVVLKQTYSSGADLTKCLLAPSTVAGASPTACQPWSRSEVMQKFQASDRMMDDVAQRFPAVVTLDPKSQFCPGEACMISDGARLFLRDTDHLTNAGSEFLVQQLRGALLAAIGGKP